MEVMKAALVEQKEQMEREIEEKEKMNAEELHAKELEQLKEMIGMLKTESKKLEEGSLQLQDALEKSKETLKEDPDNEGLKNQISEIEQQIKEITASKNAIDEEVSKFEE